MKVISILDNVVFISLVKISDTSYRIYGRKYKNGKEEQLDISKYGDSTIINNFIENLPIIYYLEDTDKIINFINVDNSTLLNLMELAAILEPSRKSYEFNEIFKDIIKNNERIELKDRLVMLCNGLLCRHWYNEEKYESKGNLYKVIKSNKLKWQWTEYLNEPVFFSFDKYSYINFEDDNTVIENNKKIIEYDQYEKLLKDTTIWRGKNFNYIYRKEQENLSKKIRENYQKNKRIFIEAPTGSGKSFAYILIAALCSYLSEKDNKYERNNFIISTDTKELQNQLINKDIPNVLNKINLHNKVKYGALKGKSNYICTERLERCDKFNKNNNGLLSKVYLYRYIEKGNAGDIEEINYWALKHFNIEEYIEEINCDSDECDFQKCKKACYLKKRYEQLRSENITVINHSLLATWPYDEKCKINNLIIDEAHNLMEKSYDFFSEEFNSEDFLNELKKISEGKPPLLFMLRKLNANHGYRENIEENKINSLVNDIKFNILNLKINMKKNNLKNKEYNFCDEFYNPERNNIKVFYYLKEHILNLKISIYYLYKTINSYIESIVGDKKEKSNEYSIIIRFLLNIKNNYDVLDNFLTRSKEFAKTIEIDKNFSYFKFKNTPLNIGKILNENIFNDVKSIAFLSATLRIDGSYKTIKSVLHQEEADEYTVKESFNLKDRTKIFICNDIGSYKEKNQYVEKASKFILQIAEEINGHLLVLFNNNNRRNEIRKYIEKININKNMEVHISKKAVELLKNKDRKIIILGSKGFFEGIDCPGDGLVCVIFDKIPNVNPTDPLFKALRSYETINYNQYNYPKVCIKLKQGYGRLIRSIYDYGYFIILDGGNNKDTLYKIEQDLNGPIFEKNTTYDIIKKIKGDINSWKKDNLRLLLHSSSLENRFSDFNMISERSNLFWKINFYDEKNHYYDFINDGLKVQVYLDEKER